MEMRDHKHDNLTYFEIYARRHGACGNFRRVQNFLKITRRIPTTDRRFFQARNPSSWGKSIPVQHSENLYLFGRPFSMIFMTTSIITLLGFHVKTTTFVCHLRHFHRRKLGRVCLLWKIPNRLFFVKQIPEILNLFSHVRLVYHLICYETT